MNKVKFGIIGTGAIAGVHAQALAASKKAELVRVYDTSSERAVSFAEKYGIEAAPTLEALLASDIDAVTIATPSGLHAEAAVAAAEAGKHVLCEKPLEVDPARCDRMIHACAERGVLLSAVFQSRYKAAAVWLKRAVEQGRFGTPIFANAFVHWFRTEAYYAQAGWRGTWALDGGGALMNQGVHTVDLLLHFAGPVAELSARTARRLHTAIEVEDTASALLTFRSGAFGALQASTTCAPGFPPRIELLGTDGSAILEGDRITRWSFVEERPEDKEMCERISQGEGLDSGAGDPLAIPFEGHRRQIDDMAESIRKGVPPPVSGGEGRLAVELICAVYESARTGKTMAPGFCQT